MMGVFLTLPGFHGKWAELPPKKVEFRSNCKSFLGRLFKIYDLKSGIY
jgi:hypothetical protein